MQQLLASHLPVEAGPLVTELGRGSSGAWGPGLPMENLARPTKLGAGGPLLEPVEEHA